MAKFTNIIPERLWKVEDLLAPDQVAEILATDWQSANWSPGTNQEFWHRRWVSLEDPLSIKFGNYIVDQLPVINDALGTDFSRCPTYFWIDEPGFTVPMHTDGELPRSMQLYWNIPSEEFGTGFYQFKSSRKPLYQFKSRPNTGYIMLNHSNTDGSQPLQWHGMFNPVPAGTLRVTSYSYPS